MARDILAVRPDILLLQRFDYDAGLSALESFADLLGEAGLSYPHRFALRPNTGWMTDLDLNGDGRTHDPEDAHGFGEFSGQGGMALLSRYPVEVERVQDLSRLLWHTLPGATLPEPSQHLSEEALHATRLSAVAQWVVPITVHGKQITVLAFHAGPPVFDGPEDRNGLRNRDELRLWSLMLDGSYGAPLEGPVVVVGTANQDPQDGDARREAIRALLAHDRLQDPEPSSAGGRAAGSAQGGVNDEHTGPASLDTVDWPDLVRDAPGNLRVDYVLPDRALRVEGSGVHWPENTDFGSRHRLVWVDVRIDE